VNNHLIFHIVVLVYGQFDIFLSC